MSFAEKKYSFTSRIDGLTISAYRIQPEDSASINGVVQLVHGMCEHKERYYDFMRYLAMQGYLCVIHDHRGHGESVKSMDDLGYMYEGGYKGLIEDTHDLTVTTKEYVKELTGKDNIPYYMLGHSMGSLVVRCYVKQYDYELNKLIISGCPSQLPGMTMGLMFIKFMKMIYGGHARSKMVDQLVSGSNFEAKFKDEKIKGAWLNTDREEVEKYNNDPLCNFSFTLNGYENLVRMTKDTYSASGYGMKNPELSVRFFSGADDPCGVSKEALLKATDVMKNAGFKDVTLVTYEGMRHEILLAPKKQMVYEDMLGFLRE